MSPTSSIVLAVGLVLVGLAVVALAIRRHRGGRHRAPEPVTTVLAARTGVGAVAVGSVASSVLVLVGHGAGTGSTVEAADRSPHGALETAVPAGGASAPASSPPHADHSDHSEGGYVVIPPPRSPADHRGEEGVSSRRRPVERRRSVPAREPRPDHAARQLVHEHPVRKHRTGEHHVRGHRAEAHRIEVNRTEVNRTEVNRTEVNRTGTDRELFCPAVEAPVGRRHRSVGVD